MNKDFNAGASEDLQAKLYKKIISTPMGDMIIITDNKSLYLLEFADYKKLDYEINNLTKSLGRDISDNNQETLVSKLVVDELNQYFAHKLTQFTVPITLIGSAFQKSVWQQLCNIPFGKTKSYALIANALNKPTSFRAVANANGANRLAIIVPCHRVINSNGKLGGYAGGISRKEWLLAHEKSVTI